MSTETREKPSTTRDSSLGLKVAAIALVGLVYALPVIADNPGGKQFTINFSGAHSIWDPGDDLVDVCESDTVDGISIEICLDFPFTVSPKGKITGLGTFEFFASGHGVTLDGTANGALKGSVKSKKEVTQLQLSLRATGSITATGVGTCGFRGQSKLKADIDATGDLLGTMDAKACVKCPGIGGACERVKGIPIADNVGNGDWTLTLNVVTDEKAKLSGQAMASTAVGTFEFDLKGKYKDKTDSSKLSGKPDAESKGTKVQVKELRVTGSAVDAVRLKYKIAGAKGEYIQ